MILSGYVRAMQPWGKSSFILERMRSVRRASQFTPFQEWHVRSGLLFIHVPKAAGTSIREFLGSPEPNGFQHIFADAYRRADPVFYESLFKFAFLRDPIERFISAYYQIQKYKDVRVHDPMLQHCKNLTDWNFFVDKFTGDVMYRNMILKSQHFLPQTFFIQDKEQNIIVDKLYSFRKLNEFEDDIKKYFKDEALLPKSKLRPTNVSKQNSSGVSIPDRMSMILNDYYARDVEMYASITDIRTV